ncbi:MAG: hypothetical protein A2506_11965 [Elusimicrobia bacterium RIFOXYD12_FULL_66_9]|nr:MAG: hypothetical protein A2506_11965 [Elusimicrobia bacterium RIFOXYD12_FULL_66_9]
MVSPQSRLLISAYKASASHRVAAQAQAFDEPRHARQGVLPHPLAFREARFATNWPHSGLISGFSLIFPWQVLPSAVFV